jgi:hypothetical protein
VVFGRPVLQEKLLRQEHGLDDVSMALLKVAVPRYVPGAPLSDATELRFDGHNNGALVPT